MSELFLNHVGGLQKFIPVVLPLFAPNVNSFRRFLPDTSAPVNVEWGEENRTVGLRVPDAGPQNRRVENRLPGADANPYLAIAASLLCGYIGMVEGLKPSAPVQGRGYERRNLRLPLTIEDALERMENCQALEPYLGKKFIAGYVATKRAEHENFKRVISSWEREFLLFAV
ncbi:Gamma-glutamylputrescine synthetase PuuA [compost metagenome]